MRRIFRRCVLVVILVVLANAPAWAQEPRGFVGVAITEASWAANPVVGQQASTTYYNGSPESSAVGLTVEVGRLLTPRVLVAFEVDIPERRDLANAYGYVVGQPQITYSRYRDLPLLGTVRRRLLPIARVHVDLAAGGGINVGSSLQRTAFESPTALTYGPFGPVIAVTHGGFAATAGADIVVDLTRHLKIVSAFHELFLPRGDVTNPPKFAAFGLKEVVPQFRVGIRMGF